MRRDEVAPRPEGGETRFKLGEFLPQYARSVAFDCRYNSVRGNCRWRLKEDVNMIGHCFEAENIATKFSSLLVNQLLKSRFNTIGDDLPPILRAPDEVIIHEVNRGLRGEIALRHSLDVCNISIKLCGDTNSSHP